MEKDGGKDDRYLTIREAVEFTSMHANTIRKYGNAGILPCYKTPTGQRRFSKAVLQEFCSGVSAPPPIPRANKTSYLYSRVSSKKQLDDLSRQAAFLSAYRPEYASYVAVSDIASGINFKRKGLQTILDACMQRTIREVVVTHRDRLCRFGFELLEYIIKKGGGTLVVIDDEKHKTSDQELAEDLLSIIHVYSCRQMGKRSYSGRKLKNPEDSAETDEAAKDGDDGLAEHEQVCV